MIFGHLSWKIFKNQMFGEWKLRVRVIFFCQFGYLLGEVGSLRINFQTLKDIKRLYYFQINGHQTSYLPGLLTP